VEQVWASTDRACIFLAKFKRVRPQALQVALRDLWDETAVERLAKRSRHNSHPELSQPPPRANHPPAARQQSRSARRAMADPDRGDSVDDSAIIRAAWDAVCMVLQEVRSEWSFILVIGRRHSLPYSPDGCMQHGRAFFSKDFPANERRAFMPLMHAFLDFGPTPQEADFFVDAGSGRPLSPTRLQVLGRLPVRRLLAPTETLLRLRLGDSGFGGTFQCFSVVDFALCVLSMCACVCVTVQIAAFVLVR
jgi:hypothetical protein